MKTPEQNFAPYEESKELEELGLIVEPCFAKYFQQDGNTPFLPKPLLNTVFL